MLLGQTAQLHFMLGELALAWSLHAAVALILCQPLLHLARARRLQAIAAAAVPLSLWAWVPPWTAPRLPPLSGPPDLTLLSANTYHHNPDLEGLSASIEASGADLVALLEPDVRLFDRLPGYRTVAANPSGDKYGIALLSRVGAPVQVVSGSTITYAFTPAPSIRAELELHGHRLQVFAIHALAPTDPAQQAERLLQVEDLMRRVETSTAPVIVFGDFNMVMASPLWRRLRSQDRLRRPPGWAPSTWPWQLGPFGIAIDHILLSAPFSASHAEAVLLPGSDHRGLLLRVALTPRGSDARQ